MKALHLNVCAMALVLGSHTAACGPAFEEGTASGGGEATSTSTGTATGGAGQGTGGQGTGAQGTGGTTEGDCSFADTSACAADEICVVDGCNEEVLGSCKKKEQSPPDTTRAVCGCDGISYWNKELAALNKVSIAANGPCLVDSSGTKTCSVGVAGGACPGNTKCGVRVKDCAMSIMSNGICWALPSTCPKNTGDGIATFRECGLMSPACKDECMSIENQRVYTACDGSP